MGKKIIKGGVGKSCGIDDVLLFKEDVDAEVNGDLLAMFRTVYEKTQVQDYYFKKDWPPKRITITVDIQEES